jgi:hypothetical protein
LQSLWDWGNVFQFWTRFLFATLICFFCPQMTQMAQMGISTDISPWLHFYAKESSPVTLPSGTYPPIHLSTHPLFPSIHPSTHHNRPSGTYPPIHLSTHPLFPSIHPSTHPPITIVRQALIHPSTLSTHPLYPPFTNSNLLNSNLLHSIYHREHRGGFSQIFVAELTPVGVICL